MKATALLIVLAATAQTSAFAWFDTSTVVADKPGFRIERGLKDGKRVTSTTYGRGVQTQIIDTPDGRTRCTITAGSRRCVTSPNNLGGNR